MDIDTLRHARTWGPRIVVALLGAVLVAPPLALAPAYAAPAAPTGLLDPVLGFLAPVEPVVNGAGSVTSTVAGLACDNPTGATQVTCSGADGLSLLELGALTQVVLTAVPADGWTFVGWTGCSSTTGADCVLDSGLVGSVIAPVATFAPTAAPDPCTVVSLPTCDTAPPVTKLTQKPTVVAGNKTKEKAATFGYDAFDDETGTTPTDTPTFACQLSKKNTTPPAFSDCSAGKSITYSNLVDGEYTFKVQASDAAGNVDDSPEVFTWTVDTTAPDTSFTSGPGAWVLAKSASFGLGSTEPGSTFRCALDSSGRYCGTSASVSFPPGTHTVTAVAKDAVGNEDASAASRTFTMPLDDKDLRRSSGWKQGKGAGYFLKTFSSTTKKGASMKTAATGIRKVALVATKGKGFGTVKVYLGKTLLKKVSLAASTTKKKKLINVASFATATSGTVKVVVVSRNKKVVIEGLGIATG